MTSSFSRLPFWCCLYLMPVAAHAYQDPQPSSVADSSRILPIGNLTWRDIDALNRDSTIVLLTIGMLEQHGPHLPVASDQIGVEHEMNHVAAALIRALPGWKVLVMPTVNYGSAGANYIGGMPVHPGTYGIRMATLRSLVADIGGQLAQNRFRWIFVLNGHGAPTHSLAVNEACDFVSEVFNVTMLNVSALFRGDTVIQAQGRKLAAKHFSPAGLDSLGLDPHAGVSETSQMLAVRPDLVRPSYRSLPNNRARTFGEMRAIATKSGWQGYFSAPAKASEAYGQDLKVWWIEGMMNLILRAVRGENLFGRPRFPGDLENDPRASVVAEVLAHEREFEQKLDRWLAQRAGR
jgi:creatinine amidohydrolase